MVGDALAQGTDMPRSREDEGQWDDLHDDVMRALRPILDGEPTQRVIEVLASIFLLAVGTQVPDRLLHAKVLREFAQRCNRIAAGLEQRGEK